MNESVSKDAEKNDEMRRALVAIRELRRRVSELENKKREPIAVVGMSCRFPGGATSPDRFWELLQNGVDATGDVPKSRWDADAIYDPDPESVGGSYVSRGGFLSEPLELFDPGFFGISPREASAMDPMHRMLLEMSWEALERANIPPFSLEGSLTGVFVGLSVSDYDLLQRNLPLEAIHSYRGTGTLASVAGGRISHFLGLQGPNMPVDTACSSGLVALVLAVESLRSGNCNLALAGTSHLMLAPEAMVFLCRMRALSKDGRCRSFDAAADGYARGEGGGMLVLKRLSDAQRANNRILAVIRGVAVNHDGHSSGLTVPNPVAQRAVIRTALADAGLAPTEIDYLEAHGTATQLGDPIELRAMADVLCQGRPADAPLRLGSVKANLGHLEAAAGITGVMKVILALQNKQLPPSINFSEPTPHFDWDRHAIRVVTELSEWQTGDHPRAAGVSAFGFSGTNAHVILAEAPAESLAESAAERPLQLIALSGRSRPAVRELAGRYRELLAKQPSAAATADLARTSTEGRSHMPYRTVAVGSDSRALAESLASIETDESGTSARIAKVPNDGTGPIVFLFTGQGAQYPGMARSLVEGSPTFRDALEHCDEIARPEFGRSLFEMLTVDNEEINQTRYTQPALFAMEYALAELWKSWGVEPAYAIGHSLGEYVAATVAGVMSLEDALTLVVARGRLMQDLPAGGKMFAILAEYDRVLEAIDGCAGLAVAAVNAPENTVISGPGDEIAAVVDRLTAAGVRCTELVVSHAFHSPLMEPMLGEFRERMSGVDLRAPQIGLISNVTGALMTKSEATDAERWCRHIVAPVRFSESIASVIEKGARTFIEVGPHPTLIGLAMETARSTDLRWLPTMRRNRPVWEQIGESIGQLYESGGEIDWSGWNRGFRGSRVDGPTYPFQRQDFWYTDLLGQVSTLSKPAVPVGDAGHPLLGVSIDSPALAGIAYQTTLTPHHPGYLNDHRVQGGVIVPAAVYIEMIIAAARKSLGWGAVTLENVVFERALALSDEDAAELQVILVPGGEAGAQNARVVSAKGHDGQRNWLTHVTAEISAGSNSQSTLSLQDARKVAVQSIDTVALYAELSQRAIEYGPAFRPLTECLVGRDQLVGRAELDESLRASISKYSLHPCLLDAGFQVLGLSVVGKTGEDPDEADATFLPAGLDQLCVFGAPTPDCWIVGRIREQPDPDLVLADLAYYDGDGNVFATISGYRSRRVRGMLGARANVADDPVSLNDIEWTDTTTPAAATIDGNWLLVGGSAALAEAIAGEMVALGANCAHIPETADDLCARQLADLGWGREGKPVQGIVSLAAFDAEASPGEEDLCAIASCLSLVEILSCDSLGRIDACRILTRGGAGPFAIDPRSWAPGAAAWGMLPVLQVEFPQVDWRAVDMDPSDPALDAGAVVSLLFSDCLEDRIAQRGGTSFVPRFVDSAGKQSEELRIPAGEAYAVAIERRGTLDALNYVAIDRRAPDELEAEVRIRVTGLNFRDVLNVLGMYPGDPGPPGVELVGVVTRIGTGVKHLRVGDEVVGLGTGAFASHVTVPAAGLLPVFAGLRSDQAATVPLAFLTAEWGLADLAGLKKDERVLIHAAAGGVGQAAVQIARAIGARVFATAGSDAKRDFLRAQGVEHVFDSRDASFADEVLEATGGEGVDVVLNSLTGDMLKRSLELLGSSGRFVELGKAELLGPDELAEKWPGIRYYSFDLGGILIEQPDVFQALFRRVAARFESENLKPLRVRSFPAGEIVDAFRYMAQARHIGKVTISSGKLPVPASSGPILADSAYIVTGAGGGVGAALVEWLLAAGAGRVVANGRRSLDVESEVWASRIAGAEGRLRWVSGDVSRMVDAKSLVEAATEGGFRLGGVMHAAGVLDDALLSEQTEPRFARVFAPKLKGALNLHLATRQLELDHFVLFSSVAAWFGGAGQCNYAAANACLGALSQRRIAEGLPSLTIDWGAWGGDGMAGRLADRERKVLERNGMGFLDPEVALESLGQLLLSTDMRKLVARIDWPTVVRRAPQAPLFRTLAQSFGQGDSSQSSVDVASFDMGELLALSAEDQQARLVEYVVKVLSAVLGVRDGQLEADTEFTQIGFDSLMAMELRNRIEVELGILVPVNNLFGGATPLGVANELVGMLSDSSSRQPETDAVVEGEI
jgi:acyl transferase domain-containing protein/acyl carrier protein